MPGVHHKGLDELDFGLASRPFVQRNARGEDGMMAIEAVAPGGVSKSMRMFALAREALAVLPAAGHLYPSGALYCGILVPRVEVAQFQLNFGLELSKEGAA